MQDFVFLTLQAFLEARGCEAYRFKRIPVFWADDVVSEQFALRRGAPLPPGADWADYAPFAFGSPDDLRA